MTYNNAMTAIASPNGTRHSTLKELREELNLTQSELADQAGVSRHAILRLEQLCYPTPLPNVIHTLSDILGTSVTVLNARYVDDVRVNRALSGEQYFYDHPYMIALAEQLIKQYANVTVNPAVHPFEQWRTAITDYNGLPSSRIHFSQLTSIHPATLARYESFKTGFPPPIEVAFKAMGFPNTLLELFKDRVFNME
jgi:transcriptional regulator with XRE-family HTH domain